MARGWHLTRTLLTAANGTTGAGLLLALASGARIRRGRHGVLLAEERATLFGHESRHAGQYAALGPLFWPAYWLSCGYSYVLTGSYGARNAFEKHAGLAAGGYRHRPLRPWAARFTRSAATASRSRPGGSPSPR